MSRQFNIIKAFNFFVYGALSVYSTFFALYLQQIGWSTLEIGTLLAGGPVVSIIANPFWGYLSDRYRNIRLIILIMLTSATLIMQIVFLAKSYAVIYTAMLFFFFFQMPMFSQSNSLILNAIEGTKRNFGSFRLWGSMGWAVLAAVSGPIIGHIGIERLWILYTVMMALSITFAFALPRGEVSVSPKSGKSNYRSIFGNRVFLMFLFLGLVLSIPNSMNQTFIGLYIVELGGRADMIGWAAFISSIFEIPVFLLLDRYLKRNVKTMMFCLIFVSLLFALRWLLMAGASSGAQIIAVQLLHCVTFGGFYYIGTQLTALLVPAEYRASGQGLYALVYGGLSGMAAGIIGGWLFQQLGAQSMYVFGAILAAVGVIGFSVIYFKMFKRQIASS